MNKWIVRLIVAVAAIYAVNEVSWWWLHTPGWEREQILSTAWKMAPTLGVVALALLIGQYLVLAFCIRRAKPVDPDTLKRITKP